MRWKRAVLRAAHRAGAWKVLRRVYGPDSLTVLCYHRVGDLESGSFRFAPMISTDAAGFEAQLRWIDRHYRAVTLEQAVDWVAGRAGLPEWPLLVTFDDGYRDNAEIAAPLLSRIGIPAALFLTTSILDGDGPLWWDRVARCFALSTAVHADLPLLGQVELGSRGSVCERMIRALKQVPESDKARLLGRLSDALGVDGAACDPGDLYLDWDAVRDMRRDGFSFGAHSVSHPILTRLEPDRAREEMAVSKHRIESELGVPVTAFAYPNGQPGDFDERTKQDAAELGFEAAFSLEPGPMRAEEARRDPMAVRRITIQRQDAEARFAAKLSGLPRMVEGAVNHSDRDAGLPVSPS